MPALIETRDLKKYFNTPRGSLHAVDKINLKIEKGQTLGVVGESGCGKTTLGRAILRLHEPTAGEVLYDGKDILAYNKHEMAAMRQKMQIIFQDPYSSLNPRLTVSEIITEPIITCKTISDSRKREEKVDQLMDTVGLADRFLNAYPHEMDGGRRQRIGIARALALDPEFIVCDEPVSALDVSIQAQILNLMMDLQENMGLTYMFITHDLSVVKHISSSILVMYLGECVEFAASGELFKNPLHPYTKALLNAIPKPALSSKNNKRTVLSGEVTSPINPEPGCRFKKRCPHAGDKCSQELQLKDMGGGHLVSCVLFQE